MNVSLPAPHQMSLQTHKSTSLFDLDFVGNVTWPSLYDPLIDLAAHPGARPVQPGGKYLTHVDDVFRFTLYWTLIFHVPLYILIGTYAFLNVLFPPTRRRAAFFAFGRAGKRKDGDGDGHGDDGGRGGGDEHIRLDPPQSLHPDTAYRTSRLPRSSISSLHHGTSADDEPRQPRPRLNVRRTRLTFALVVFFAFVVLSIVSAVASAAVMGFVIGGVYKAGGFWVSTWVPFIWAVIHALVGLLGVWPSVIDII
ncbi:hypothetical protein V8B97DRAFT_2021218 [Scleroderma yunnanense]